MPISKRFTRDLLLLASDHAKLFGAVSECKLPGSPSNDGVDKIDNFPSHQHVLFSVGFLIADAFLGKQNLRDMIPWDSRLRLANPEALLQATCPSLERR